jgi:hypothetical protein
MSRPMHAAFKASTVPLARTGIKYNMPTLKNYSQEKCPKTAMIQGSTNDLLLAILPPMLDIGKGAFTSLIAIVS